MYNIINDDCLNGMKTFDNNHFHSCVTDPPYGLNFMGKNWDHGVPNKIYWQEVFRVLKPGGHLLAFGGTRMFHRLMVEIEDAGFEIRDTIMWVYGSGFPKGNNISKTIDKMLGNEPEIVCKHPQPAGNKPNGNSLNMSFFGMPQENVNITKPSSDIAKQWDGWNTNLKPAWEPIIVARKPVEGTVAQNVMEHGTGAINIDACRVGETGGTKALLSDEELIRNATNYYQKTNEIVNLDKGRYPANLIHDGMIEFPNSAARFFYCAKASPKDRDEGLVDVEKKRRDQSRKDDSQALPIAGLAKHGNHHPTVKPTSLMQYLCRLVTPKDGIILDPFCGSGSTGKGAILEGFNFIGIEKEAEYADIARKRCEYAFQSFIH